MLTTNCLLFVNAGIQSIKFYLKKKKTAATLNAFRDTEVCKVYSLLKSDKRIVHSRCPISFKLGQPLDQR